MGVWKKEETCLAKRFLSSAIFHFGTFIFLPLSSDVFGECVYFGQIL